MAIIFNGHSDSVWDVAFSPDCSRVASASWDKTVAVIDLATGKEVRRLTGCTAGVRCVMFSPDGTQVASAGWDEVARVWDVDTMQQIMELKGHTAFVSRLAWSHDGVLLATASDDCTVRVWDLLATKPVFVLRGHKEFVVAVAFSIDRKLLVTGSDDKTARVWDMRTGHEIAVFRDHSDVVRFVSFTDDSKQIITASLDNTVRCWDIMLKTEERKLKIKQTGQLFRAAISPDGSFLVTGETNGANGRHAVRITHLETAQELAVLADDLDEVYSIAVSRDGQWIAAGGNNNLVQIWATPSLIKQNFKAKPWRLSGVPPDEVSAMFRHEAAKRAAEPAGALLTTTGQYRYF